MTNMKISRQAQTIFKYIFKQEVDSKVKKSIKINPL